MLEALGIELPKVIPKNEMIVVTKKRRRKSVIKN